MTLVFANIASLSVIFWQFLKERFYILKKHFTSDYKVWKWFWKKFPDLKFFSLILAENPLFFPDFPDWKKSSKISLNSLISLIGKNPDLGSKGRGGEPSGPPGSACAFRQNSFNEARTLPHNKPTYIPLVRLEIHRDYYSEHCSNWN